MGYGEERQINQALRRLACLILKGLLLWPGIPGQAEALGLYDKGQEVKALKPRLFDLGYFQSVQDASDTFSKDTQEKVSLFQAADGLPASGQADAATLAAVNRPDIVKAPLPEGRPGYNTKPGSMPALPGAPCDAGGPEGYCPYCHRWLFPLPGAQGPTGGHSCQGWRSEIRPHFFPELHPHPFPEALALFGAAGSKPLPPTPTAPRSISAWGCGHLGFGPALVREGEVPRYFCSRDYRSYREIRCALA